jgi:predicted Rossmann-fold nucleotide-binding protein
MAAAADLLAAFPGGRGTANMVEETKRRHITIVESPTRRGNLRRLKIISKT